MSHQSSMTNYINAFIQGLIDGGVSQAVISPGSRSTPVSILLHQRSEIKTYIDVDERSAGFFALGLSKASKKPVTLVCTSGTAAANYLPAISEAKQSNVPLVIVTTDRPHELRDSGAPQTMNQFAMYGSQVKQFVEMALPEGTEEMYQYAYVQGTKLSSFACTLPQGPVHLNVPLREPLLPDLELTAPRIKPVDKVTGKMNLSIDTINMLSQKWSGKKGVFIVGPSFDEKAVELLIKLSEQLGWVILADPLANIRTFGINSPTISPYYDTYLRYVKADIAADIIVRFGKLPVSKPLNQWLATFTGEYYLVEPTTEWLDASKMMTTLIVSDEVNFLSNMLETSLRPTKVSWLDLFKKLDQIVLNNIKKQDMSLFSEGNITQVVYRTMKTDDQLFISNSMPIRDLDTYLPVLKKRLTLYGNRGVNGIDGVTSTALGVAANDITRHTRLLIGDLSCFHDTTGLSMATKYQLPITIVVINNDGGGIFSMLSQKELPSLLFDDLFATSTNVNFEYMANMVSIDYSSVTSLIELERLLEERPNYPRLIEVRTNRAENAELRRVFQQEVRQMIESDVTC